MISKKESSRHVGLPCQLSHRLWVLLCQSLWITSSLILSGLSATELGPPVKSLILSYCFYLCKANHNTERGCDRQEFLTTVQDCAMEDGFGLCEDNRCTQRAEAVVGISSGPHCMVSISTVWME